MNINPQVLTLRYQKSAFNRRLVYRQHDLEFKHCKHKRECELLRKGLFYFPLLGGMLALFWYNSQERLWICHLIALCMVVTHIQCAL